MLIKVTQKHIDKGYRASGFNCPVAHAIKEQTNLDDPYITCTGVTFYVSSLMIDKICFPEQVKKNIRKFDEVGEMIPFEFTLEELDTEHYARS